VRSLELNAVFWRQSSYSNSGVGACVEVSDDFAAVVPVRDSKCPYGPALIFGVEGWSSFVSAVKDGAVGA
jgi:Domain of unknown function (DUF397).